LRLSEHAGVDACAAAAGRDVIRSAADGFAERVAHARGETLRESFLEPRHLRDLERHATAEHPLETGGFDGE